GDNHLDVAENIVNLGAIDMQTGKVDEAISLFEKAERIYHRLLLGDYPALANTLANHARALDRAGRYQESMAKYSEALAMLRRLFGDDHPDLATALNNLAVLQYKLGDFRGAADHFRQVLAIWKKQGTPNHPLAQISTIHLASALRDLGDVAQSEALLRPAIVQAGKTFGANHPATLLARIELGVTLRSENKMDESLSLQREVVAIIKKNASLPPLFKAKAELQFILTELASGDKLAAKTQMLTLQKTFAAIKAIDPVAQGEFLLAKARVHIATGDEAKGCSEAQHAVTLAQTVFGKHNVRAEKAAKVANDPACAG
ncbi:MAG: tetratricopeptide repeat protein, partial [Xanthomonadales bacterium]|nr:tetratricopeptide repeat protein [Xanthomonadales bacterium]